MLMSSRWCFNVAALAAVTLIGWGCPARCPAQSRGGVETVTKTGTLAEAKTAGKLTTMTVDLDDGEQLEVKVTPTVQLSVTASGDPGFVVPGAIMSGTGVNNQNQLVLEEVTIHLLPANRRPATGRIQKADTLLGETDPSYNVSGPIVAVAPSQEFPGYTALTLKIGGQAPPILLSRDYQVRVNSADPAHAVAGSKVELTGKALRGGKFNVTAVKVIREEALNSAEILEKGRGN